MDLLLIRHGLRFRRGRKHAVSHLMVALMAFEFRPSWPTIVRPRAPSGGQTLAFPPLIRPSRPQRRHDMLLLPLASFTCPASAREPQKQSIAPCHCCRESHRRIAPSSASHCAIARAHRCVLLCSTPSTHLLSRSCLGDWHLAGP